MTGRMWNFVFFIAKYLSCKKICEIPTSELDGYFQSAFDGDVSSIEKYLSAGRGPNDSMPDGRTVLHLAVEGGVLVAIKLLLERGALVNSKGFNGYTALHIAVHNSLDQVVQENIDPNKLDADVVKLLLQAGADIHVKDGDGKSAIEIAEIYNSEKMVALLESLA